MKSSTKISEAIVESRRTSAINGIKMSLWLI